MWLYDKLKDLYALKKHLYGAGGETEVKYVPESRAQEGVQGIEWDCDAKHARTLLKEGGMGECKGNDNPPITKAGGGGSLDLGKHCLESKRIKLGGE